MRSFNEYHACVESWQHECDGCGVTACSACQTYKYENDGLHTYSFCGWCVSELEDELTKELDKDKD